MMSFVKDQREDRRGKKAGVSDLLSSNKGDTWESSSIELVGLGVLKGAGLTRGRRIEADTRLGLDDSLSRSSCFAIQSDRYARIGSDTGIVGAHSIAVGDGLILRCSLERKCREQHH